MMTETTTTTTTTSVSRQLFIALTNTLDNICTLHEKQASLEAIDYAIEQARVLLKEINSTEVNAKNKMALDSYIDTVLTDIHKEGDTTK
tara:strand:+ start:232 stop:498 length:267 start_codon:yes stop_codon:yes gene_type:complete